MRIDRNLNANSEFPMATECAITVTPKGVLPPALCHAGATREGP